MKNAKGTELNNIRLRKKIIIIFLDYLIIVGIISLLSNLINIAETNPWTFRFLIYILYYFISELVFNRTLGMKILNVRISGKKRMEINRSFLIYSLLIFLDRIVVLFIYIFAMLLQSNWNLLWSEKNSGMRWIKE